MKKIIFRCMLLAALGSFMLVSCDSNKTSETTTSTDSITDADTGMESKMDNTMSHMDTGMNKMAHDSGMKAGDNSMNMNSANDFMMKAASGGMMEVEMARLAQKNGESKEVKDYGKMLETDHTKANNELKKIASGKNVTLPGSMAPEHSMHMTEMESKKGNDFDKAYITMMVEDHNKDIDMFRKAAAENPDNEIKNFASKTLPVLEKHLARAKAIQEKM